MAKSKKSYDELSNNEKINEKKRKIKRLFHSLTADRKQFADALIAQFAVTSVTLERLADEISNGDLIEDFVQGSQSLRRESPALKAYNATIKSFTTLSKSLLDLLPEQEKKTAGDELMFQIRDEFGGTTLLLEQIEKDSREGLEATCKTAAILAERGELIRRRLGYEPGPIPESEDFALLVRPFEIVGVKRAIVNAISLGYGREIVAAGDDEYDEGLAELNQKKTPLSGRNITA